MRWLTKRSLGSAVLVGSLTFAGYVAAQQSANQPLQKNPNAVPRQNPRDRLEKLVEEVKDLQSEIADLSAIGAQDRQNLEQALRTENQEQNEIDKLGQQISRMQIDLDRVKNKVGLF